MEAAETVLAKSAQQRVQTVRVRRAPGLPRRRHRISGKPSRHSPQTASKRPGDGIDRVKPGVSPGNHPGQRQTDAESGPSRPQRPSGRKAGFTRRRPEHAGTRRLIGCATGRDAQRSSATSQPADRTGLFQKPGPPGCDTGRAARTCPSFTYPVRICRGAPRWRRRGRLDAYNNRRPPAPGLPHEFAAGQARRTAPRRHSQWQRPC